MEKRSNQPRKLRAHQRRVRSRVPTQRLFKDLEKRPCANLHVVNKEQSGVKEKLQLKEQTPGELGKQWFENGPLPMMAFDRDNLSILAVNEAAIHLYGYSREEFLAMTIKDIRPPEDIPHLHEALRTGDRGLGGRFTGRHRKKVGTLFDVEVYSHPQTGSRSVVLAQIHDMTEHRRTDSKDRLQLLLEINNALVTKLDTHDLLAAVSASLRRVTRHVFSQLCLYDAQTRQLVVRAADFPAGGKGLIHEGLLVPLENTSAGLAYTSVQPLIIASLERNRFPSEVTDRMLEEGVKSVCLAPLVSHNRTLGVLSIGRSEEAAFSAADLEVLVAVAQQVSIALENALAFEQIAELNQRLALENLYLDEEVRASSGFENIIGESPALKQVLRQAEIAAPTDATVLVLGETGTGKELIARDIHDLSPRNKAAFVKLNCSAIPTGLLESELFGHEKGAFTGALGQKIGRLELAHRGTLFLDEVGDLPLELQPKLLRVLQDGEFERLGGTKTIHTDVRIVAATNRDLDQMMADLEFREDLYYRLNVVPITLPPLRERVEDIPMLVSYFVEKYARNIKKRISTIPQPVMQDLMSWNWPGNIRELQNVLQRAVILSPGPFLEVPLADLTKRSKHDKAPVTTLQELEREYVLRILRETKGVIGTPQGAAAKLGLKRTTLHAKLRKLGITRRDFMT